MKVKIGAVQMMVKPWDLRQNLLTIEGYFKQAKEEKINIIAFPEYCYVGPDYDQTKINTVAAEVKEKMSGFARQHKMYCIAGTFEEHHTHDNKKPHTHNFCYVYGPDGKEIGRYAKRHPVPALEEPIIRGGDTHRVFDTEFGKIGIQICRDILYPEVTHTTANLGAKIIFSPAFWWKTSNVIPSAVGKYHAYDELQTIKYIVPSRALENSVYFVFINAAGDYNYANDLNVMLGYTQVCQPFKGVKKIFRHNKAGLLTTTLDLDVVDEARRGWRIRGH